MASSQGSSLLAREGKTALVLSGGGARAAYQVGVLQAIAEILGQPLANPFPIICGTSAGGVNAGSLAVYADNFAQAVHTLGEVWRNFQPGHVYRADVAGVAANSLRWFSSLIFGAFIKAPKVSLFDNRPLQSLLEQHLDFSRIRANIDLGALDALAITCSGYTSGQSCSFFEGRDDLQGWNRFQRLGIKTAIRVDHLMASTAIPFIFPAYRVNREFFGDGSMRQVAPLSAALHLGADRVLVIGAARILSESPPRERCEGYPSRAQMAGHVLNSVFHDSLPMDLERIEAINRILSVTPSAQLSDKGIAFRHVDALVITPSEALDAIARKHLRQLPVAIRALLRSLGAMRRGGANLASYLLFEEGYCCELMALGRHDAMLRRDEIESFLVGAMSPVPGSFSLPEPLRNRQPVAGETSAAGLSRR